MTQTALLFDGLLLSALGGSAILIAASLVIRRIRSRDSGSHHTIYQIVFNALLCSLGVLFVTLFAKPEPLGCLTVDCPAEAVGHFGESQRQFTFAAAGKFDDLAFSEFAATGHHQNPSWILGSLCVWGVGLIVLLSRMVIRRIKTARLIRAAVPIRADSLIEGFRRACEQQGMLATARLLHHDDVDVPVAGGTFRPVIFLPSGLESRPAAQIEIILLHELAHLQRRDPLATLFAELTTACFWFNPLVWKAANQIRKLQELGADSQVLNAGVKPSDYAQCLLNSFRDFAGSRPTPMPSSHSILGDSLIETRLRTILEADRSHQAPSRTFSVGVVALFCTLSVLVAFAPKALSQSTQGTHSTNVLSQDADSATESEPVLSILNPTDLDAILRPVFIDTMADRHISGAAIAIVHGGESVYQQGFGHQEVYRETPVDAHRTIFRIGSISKVVTGIAVMQLVDRGLLDLDADVNDYLEAFKIPETYDEPVRVRHLLTHTAGFDQIGLGRHVMKIEEVLPLGDFLKDNLIRIRPPGQVSCYDTYAITLAGYLVEQRSGMPFERYLIQEIFKPLGMHRSGIVIPPALDGDVAMGYEFQGKWLPMRWEFMNTGPASTVNATVTDMAKLAGMMLQKGQFKGKQILSAKSAQAMLTQQFTNHPDHPGFGLTFWEDNSHGVPAFTHGGSMTGFSAFLFLVPELDLGVYLSYNREIGGLIEAVISQLLDALLPDRPDARALKSRYEKPSDLSRFAGTYASNMHHHTNPATGWIPRPLDVEIQGQALMFKGKAAYRVGPLDFQRDDGVLLSFRQNPDGKISYLFINQSAYERLAPQEPSAP